MENAKINIGLSCSKYLDDTFDYLHLEFKTKYLFKKQIYLERDVKDKEEQRKWMIKIN